MEKVDTLLGKADIGFTKTPVDAWAFVEARINDETATKVVQLKRFNNHLLRIAAVMVIMFGIPSVMKTYRVTVVSNNNGYAVTLPDGSEARLSADAELQYYPLWWNISRRLTLRGKAYFSVVKGNRFEVKSHNGVTKVLGTSFTINSKPDVYSVLCITGKVSVYNSTAGNVILLPNQQAVIEHGKIKVTNAEPACSDNLHPALFTFTSEPIGKVFENLAEVYNVKIDLQIADTMRYSGSFTRQRDVAETLNLVCKPFNLTFVQKSKGEFIIGYK